MKGKYTLRGQACLQLKATNLLTNLKAETGSFSSLLTLSPTWIKPNYQIWYVQNTPQQNKEVYSPVSTLL